MFEIGSILRDARVRQDISLQQAEADTKIRVKYIQAMENEDFDVLPGGTYVKGFLRTYSEYLGIDYQLVLDEYNDRYGSGEHREHLLVETGKNDKSNKLNNTSRGKVRRQTNYLFVAIFAVMIIAVLAYLGWGNSTSEKPTLVNTGTTGTSGTATAGDVPAEPQAAIPPSTDSEATPADTPAGMIESLVLTADVDDSWVRVSKDKEGSEILWENVLASGESKTFTFTPSELPDQQLIVNIGNPLLVEVNGQSQRLSTGVYMVTPSSIAELP
jgi:cytoskeleton protein RodZ